MANPKTHLYDRDGLRINNTLLFFLSLVLLITNFVSIYYVYRSLNRQKTVIMPPNITKPLEFVGNNLPQDYLKDMTRFIMSLSLNYHYGSVRNNYDDLLRFYAPEVHEDARRQFYEYVTSVEKLESKSSFYINNIAINGEDIVVSGVRRISSKKDGKEENVEKNEKWVLKYKVEDLKFSLLSIKPLEGE